MSLVVKARDKAIRVPQEVRIYRNLHQGRKAGKPIYSVVNKETGRVVLHVTSFTLSDATFNVRKAGREKVLREGRKNVHAFVEGTLEGYWGKDRDRNPVYRSLGLAPVSGPQYEVTYNPYQNETFVQDGVSIFKAHKVFGSPQGLLPGRADRRL